MKNDQQQQARNLYFQTELSKTQIADLLNISRRTLTYWVKEGDWNRLKMCTMHMPALLAENCYHIMGHLTNYMLSERRMTNPCTRQEADTLHKLVLTITKLKNRSTLNENMEMFAFFLDGLNKSAPDLAEQVQPHVDHYISSRASVYAQQMMPDTFTQMGYIPAREPDYKEQQLDAQDLYELELERNNAGRAEQVSDFTPGDILETPLTPAEEKAHAAAMHTPSPEAKAETNEKTQQKSTPEPLPRTEAPAAPLSEKEIQHRKFLAERMEQLLKEHGRLPDFAKYPSDRPAPGNNSLPEAA